MNTLNKDTLKLIIKKINHGLDYFSFMRVNKLCYRCCKELLIHKQGKGKQGRLRTWTEIPGAPGLINGIMKRVSWEGRTVYEHGYINGNKHGIVTGYHKVKQMGWKGFKEQLSKGYKYKFLYKNGREIKDIQPWGLQGSKTGKNIMEVIIITTALSVIGAIFGMSCITLYRSGKFIFYQLLSHYLTT